MNETLSLILLSALAVVALVMFGAWIGHKLTLKSFAYVQPSVKDMANQLRATVKTEPDPWDEAMKEPEDGEKPEEAVINRMFEKTGLPSGIIKKKKFFSNFYGPDTEDIMNAEEMVEKETENV